MRIDESTLATAAAATEPPSGQRLNWAGNTVFTASRLVSPASVAEVQQLMHAGGQLKALGVGHSFNSIADSGGTQVSLRRFTAMSLDAAAGTVTVGAGVTYGALAPWLDARGFAIHNLASLPHISIVGACATGTHGSGSRNGSLATAALAIEFVNGRGEYVRLCREQDRATFAGAIVALGALGIVTAITLRVVPRFAVAQAVYENLSFDALTPNLEETFAGGYSVSLFTDWQHHRATQAWVKRLARPQREKLSEKLPEAFYGARLQSSKLHPLSGHPAENCTEQMGIAGDWYQRLPHFRMEFTPSSGAELQTEYFVARRHAVDAIAAVEQLRDRITPLLIVSELRTIAADDLWLSMAYQRDALALHFTWKPHWDAVQHVLPLIERALAPFDARPHWAKLYTMPPATVRALYPRFTDFIALRDHHDPDRRFDNAFLQQAVFGA